MTRAMCIHGRVAIVATMTLCVLVSSARAQTNTGQILGFVRDLQGGLLSGATVIAEHLETRTRVAQLTDDKGRYALPSLRVGTYSIVVELMGFQRLIRQVSLCSWARRSQSTSPSNWRA